MEDPHRSLTGTLASVKKNYVKVRLLGTEHSLINFLDAAFPDASHNNQPNNPFQQLRNNSDTKTVVIEPEFCSTSTNTEQCVPDDTHVTLKLPGNKIKFTLLIEGFSAEFHWLKFDGTD